MPKKSKPLDYNFKTGEFWRKYKQGIVSTSVMEDAEKLAVNLRHRDIEELHFAERKDGASVLKDSIENAKICLTLKDLNGAVAAMFGVGWTQNPRVGRVWLLSSDYLYEVGRLFLLECPSYIDLFMRGHDVIYNHVHNKNVASIKWLEWLQFEPTASFPEYGYEKQPFTEFSRFSSDAVRDLYLGRDWNMYVNTTNC